VDDDGKRLLSFRTANDEAEIVGLVANAAALAPELIGAVDIIGAPSALLLALLAHAGQSVRYASGRVVAAMSDAYAGEGKTDAKDAYVIAETARLHWETLLHPRQRRWRLFLDSTALRVLATAAERCASVIGALILTNVPTRLRRIIQITGLHSVLIIDTTCDSHTRERT